MMIAVRTPIPVSDDRTRKADSRVNSAADPTRPEVVGRSLATVRLHTPMFTRLPYTPAARRQIAQESHRRTSPSSTIFYTPASN